MEMQNVGQRIVKSFVLFLISIMIVSFTGCNENSPKEGVITIESSSEFQKAVKDLQIFANTTPQNSSLCTLNEHVNNRLFELGFGDINKAQEIGKTLQPHAIEFSKKLLEAFQKKDKEKSKCIKADQMDNGLFVVDTMYMVLRLTVQEREEIRKVLTEEEEKKMSISGAKGYVSKLKDNPRFFGNAIARIVEKYNLKQKDFDKMTDADWKEIQSRKSL